MPSFGDDFAYDSAAMARVWQLMKQRFAQLDPEAPERMEKALADGQVSFRAQEDGLEVLMGGHPVCLIAWATVSGWNSRKAACN